MAVARFLPRVGKRRIFPHFFSHFPIIFFHLSSFFSPYFLPQFGPSCGQLPAPGGGGRKRLPKFKFSAKFPIGLHVILQIQIRKFENDCYIMLKIILTENPSRFNVEPLLK